MAKYLKLFENHTQYETFIGGGGDTPFVRPNVSHCIAENEVHYNPKTMADKYLTVRILEDGNLGFEFNSYSSEQIPLDYSFNGGITWDGTLTNDNNTILVTNGQEISFKRGNITSNVNSASGPLRVVIATNYGNFFSNCQFEVFGNAMSIIDSENFANTNVIHGELQYLFDNCTKLVNAENLILPATELVRECYKGMFNGCTSLVNAPSVLPAMATEERCYENMFYGCTSLVNAPELPALVMAVGCYIGMFENCTSLVNAPELPAMILNGAGNAGCYNNMFRGCTSLVNAPELPATSLASSCYQYMFEGCTSLVNAPELPATSVAKDCYVGMFSGCTSMTTAPELPALSLTIPRYDSGCYERMFEGCTNLNYIKAMFTTTPSTSYTNQWVSGVAANGTFVKNSAATWNVTGVNGIPSGWTVETATE